MQKQKPNQKNTNLLEPRVFVHTIDGAQLCICKQTHVGCNGIIEGISRAI
jgi:hypothetical protein